MVEVDDYVGEDAEEVAGDEGQDGVVLGARGEEGLYVGAAVCMGFGEAGEVWVGRGGGGEEGLCLRGRLGRHFGLGGLSFGLSSAEKLLACGRRRGINCLVKLLRSPGAAYILWETGLQDASRERQRVQRGSL